ncbi:Protease 2 [Candidatus Zixiibacteriota bacterium]|nr:Protease 2 [candidate division Zixibacteria bacterium]
MLSMDSIYDGFTVLVFLGFIFAAGTVPARGQEPVPPVAKVIPKADTNFGDIRIDNYYWLRDKENPEVIKYLEAENAYTDAVMKPTEAFQQKLYDEILARIKQTDLSVPEKVGDYYYYSKTEAGKQYHFYCRKKGTLEAPEEVLLDLNQLAEGAKYLSLGILKISPDQNLAAYTLDTNGEESYSVFVKDLTTGKVLEKIADGADAMMDWGDDTTLFYTILDDTHRPYRLYRHILGHDPHDDVLVYEEKDEAYFLAISQTRSREYLLLNATSNVTSEVRYLRADNPFGEFRIIQPRQRDIEYSVDQRGDKFYIFTNENARNFKLMEAPVDAPSRANWKEVLPYDDNIKIDTVFAFKNYLVIMEREKGLQRILILNPDTGESHFIEFPEPTYAIYAAANREFNTDIYRFTYTSLVTPASIYDYNMTTRTRELMKRIEILGGYDSSQYQSERLYAPASDGALIPISMVYKKGMPHDGSSPMLLYGYGAYGLNSDPHFASDRLSLLNRGFIYAIAHVRGGGEMGRQWYDEGRLLKKKNTITDFIACAEYLIKEKYTSPNKLAIEGASAGGILIGGAINMRPDLFAGAVLQSPFVDVLNTMLDSTLPLTVTEYEEWGNPHEKIYYDYIKSYSPYDNVAAHEYPSLLIHAGLNDPRVSYWEPAKWTAKLRALKTDNHILMLKTSMGSGHFGESGRYAYLKETAFNFVYLLHLFGINE